ncbi:hypothetical protein [Algoriphagus boritolerans]|uniref:hypothetical protein n=1 Tax=Algoriphagus boritolerans TaxID=308111 RepID=UPI000A90F43D
MKKLLTMVLLLLFSFQGYAQLEKGVLYINPNLGSDGTQVKKKIHSAHSLKQQNG